MSSNIALVTTSEEASITSEGPLASLDYLTLNVPSSNTCPQVKTVQVECSSHDQGWASDPNTTSYSWIDLLVRNDGVEVHREERVFSNLVAKEDYCLYVKMFDEKSSVVQKLTPGCELVLVLNALYPGWGNYANYARLSINY